MRYSILLTALALGLAASAPVANLRSMGPPCEPGLLQVPKPGYLSVLT